MRVLLVLLLAGLCAGCLLVASTRMEHPETGDVRYCWQSAYADEYGMIYGDTGRNRVCIAEWQSKGYIEAPNLKAPGF